MVEPHEKSMKMQWITVDGRSVPVVLPQIWDYELEDWVVTSTANPIPTQLTGSLDGYELPVVIEKNIDLIEIFNGNGIVLPPSARTYVGEAIDIGKYSQLFIQFRPGSAGGLNAYTLSVVWHQGDTSTPAFPIDVLEQEGGTVRNRDSEWFVAKGVKASIAITNNTNEDRSFIDLSVFGRRL